MSSSTVITGGAVLVMSSHTARHASCLEDPVVFEVDAELGGLRFSHFASLRRRRDGSAVGMRSSLTANPAPTPVRMPGVWDGGHTGTVSGRVACDSHLGSGYPTMKT